MTAVALGEIADQIRGVSYGKADVTDQPADGYVPVLRANNITDTGLLFDDLVYVRAAKVSEKQKIRAGDIIIAASSGSISVVGRAAQAETDLHAGFGAFCKVVRPSAKVDARYLGHFFRTSEYRQTMSALAAGANINNLKNEHIDDLIVPLPPLEKQRRIAAILDQADKLHRLRQRSIDRMNDLGKAIFYEMFGDPLGDLNNDLEWTTEELGSNVEFMDYRGKTPLKAENGIRLITARNVKMGFINIEPMEFVEADSYDSWMTRGFPKRGDILFTTEAPLGHVAQLDTDEKVVIGQRLITMKPNPRLIRPKYLEFFLRTPSFRRKMFENSTGSTVVGIKSKLLKKIDIRYPSGRQQDKFELAIQQLRATGPHVAISSSRFNDLFVSLQHKAFSGELTASSLTEAAE
jgi:type I restriction enzyme S subunit